MKKSLIALACMGACAGSAMAADVTVYGIVDTGLMYNYQDTTNMFGVTTVDGESSFGMESGIESASRFGLKGTEDLGNGMTVSFKLENGFDSDSGKMGQNDRLFGREASLSLSGAFGTVSFGRMGGLTSAAGTYDLFFSAADVFDGGDNYVVTGFTQSDRYDNMITFKTPEFAGVTGYAQYAFNTDGQENAQTSKNEKYAALGATFNGGALQLVGAVDMKMRKATEHNVGVGGGRPTPWFNSDQNDEDQYTINLGGSYDFGTFKFFAAAQYAKNANNFAGQEYGDVMPTKSINPTYNVSYLETAEGIDGYALHIGTLVKVGAGDLLVGAYYADGETDTRTAVNGSGVATDEFKADLTYIGLSARYVYPLSKRTALYAGAGYAEAKADYSAHGVNGAASTKTGAALDESKDKIAQAYFGLRHSF